MDPAGVGSLAREGLFLIATVGLPLFSALLLLGLVLGVLQSATQINDPAVGFVPRLSAAVGLVWLLGPWMVHRLAAFFVAAVMRFVGHP